MGRDEVMAPGDDSFQNELIRAAGGVPPVWDKPGAIVPVTLEEWQRFNPQVLYGCGGDRDLARAFFSRPEWQEVEAVKKGQIHYFPCDLTCRAATHTGDFTAWLSSVIYTETFADPRGQVRPDGITYSRPLKLDLPIVQAARITASTIQDFPNKTLIIEFTSPQKIVSTMEGQRDGISVVGNHYSPPPAWSLDHLLGLEEVRRRLYGVLGQSPERASFLFTGADMDNLAVRQFEFKELKVIALVTAGVESNAVRMSRDRGDYYEPGTINIILLTNRSLSPRTMTRAIIDATEAKTAALWDMDIRSSFTSRVNPATGTGTDNIIVVQGTGGPLDNAGGHTKLGELIASAVYAGVQEAIHKQNGIVPGRKIFQRLQERRLELYALSSQARLACGSPDRDYAAMLEEALLEPTVAGFMESALVISDAHERGLIQDLGPFRQWCRLTASEIAGQPVRVLLDPLGDADLPPVIRMAFNALLSGLHSRPASAAIGPKAP
jgi:adenosylcobinamide amidohydrolase